MNAITSTTIIERLEDSCQDGVQIYQETKNLSWRIFGIGLKSMFLKDFGLMYQLASMIEFGENIKSIS